MTNDAGSDYSSLPTISISFHAYSPPSDTNPTLFEPEVQVLKSQTIQAERIYQYIDPNGESTSSFFRFIMEFPLQDIEMAVRYRLNGGAAMDFVVPARGQNLRWAAHSCNGELAFRYAPTTGLRTANRY